MRIHITNLYGCRIAGQVQNMVANIAKNYFQYNELGIYGYRANSDSAEMLRARLDGILASVSHGDVIILQLPTWNGLNFERTLIRRLNNYKGLKKIFFMHDIEPLMFGGDDKIFSKYINLYNQADLIILPSQKMADILYSKGLSVAKIVVQRMWDFPVSIDTSIIPQLKRVIHFIGDVNQPKFSFAKKWMYDTVKLAVTAKKDIWIEDRNIDCLGWFNNENLLANALRKYGGFGLLWTEDPICSEYMKFNACSKLSTYLAAGLPVIVSKNIPESDTVLNKNLGVVVTSLDEAVHKIECITEEQYNQMVFQVASFGELIRGGYFTKKLLIEAVFRVLYD